MELQKRNYSGVNLVGKRGTLSAVQKIPEFEINGRVVLQPNTWYTCPAGKKAIVKGQVQCTGLGAAANASFEAAGVIMFTWLATGASRGYIESPRNLNVAEDEFAFFDIELSAGEFIRTIQNTGTNSEFNVFAKVQETPA